MVKNLELNLSYFRIRCLETVTTKSKHAVAVVEITKKMWKKRTKDKAAIKNDSVIQKFREEKENLENKFEASERNWNVLKNADKFMDTEIYDLKKVNCKGMVK